jgi:hypothetical protein
LIDAFPARNRRVVDVLHWVALENVDKKDRDEKADYHDEGAPDEVFDHP